MRRSFTPLRRPTVRTLAGRLGALVLAGVLAGTSGLGAQQVPPERQAIDDTVPVASPRPQQLPLPAGVSPRGAFLRAVAIPGWGHSAIGSYRRGAFYFIVEGVTAWGLIKTHQRILEANRRVDFRESLLREDLAAAGITDPDTIQARLADDEALTDLLALQGARKSQRQDWTALGIFLVFLSGADAYVSAHLEHFPAPLTVDAQPAPTGNGRMDVAVRLKLPR